MKRKGLDSMAAFAKLLVLIAIFLSASNANAFTSLSPVTGNQVQENHWFQFVEPMSKPTNEPTGKPTKQESFQTSLHLNGEITAYRKSRMQSFQARLLF
jgi:hypothetical protein